MPIHTYIIEDPSTPEGFKDLLENVIKGKSKFISVVARRVSDELSKRRRSEEEQQKFTFRIYEIHPTPEDFFLNAQDIATQQWVHITVAEKVSFTLVS